MVAAFPCVEWLAYRLKRRTLEKERAAATEAEATVAKPPSP